MVDAMFGGSKEGMNICDLESEFLVLLCPACQGFRELSIDDR
jgi:hypothetical protein